MLIDCPWCGNRCADTALKCPRCSGLLEKPRQGPRIVVHRPTYSTNMKAGLGLVGAALVGLLLHAVYHLLAMGALKAGDAPWNRPEARPTTNVTSIPIAGGAEGEVNFDAKTDEQVLVTLRCDSGAFSVARGKATGTLSDGEKTALAATAVRVEPGREASLSWDAAKGERWVCLIRNLESSSLIVELRSTPTPK